MELFRHCRRRCCCRAVASPRCWYCCCAAHDDDDARDATPQRAACGRRQGNSSRRSSSSNPPAVNSVSTGRHGSPGNRRYVNVISRPRADHDIWMDVFWCAAATVRSIINRRSCRPGLAFSKLMSLISTRLVTLLSISWSLEFQVSLLV